MNLKEYLFFLHSFSILFIYMKPEILGFIAAPSFHLRAILKKFAKSPFRNIVCALL